LHCHAICLSWKEALKIIACPFEGSLHYAIEVTRARAHSTRGLFTGQEGGMESDRAHDHDSGPRIQRDADLKLYLDYAPVYHHRIMEYQRRGTRLQHLSDPSSARCLPARPNSDPLSSAPLALSLLIKELSQLDPLSAREAKRVYLISLPEFI
jgi:hypothetical protein